VARPGTLFMRLTYALGEDGGLTVMVQDIHKWPGTFL
jgi:hypothetical protein